MNSKTLPHLALAGLLTLTVPLTSHADHNWPSFQNGGVVSFQAPDSSSTLADAPAWEIELTGYGQSSPVVWKNHVYLTSVEGPNKETYRITAYRLHDGSRLWEHKVPNASPAENTGYVSRAAPTPAADNEGVIAFFEGGNLIALTHSGQLRWERNLEQEYGPIGARHGLSASIEQNPALAFIWVERAEAPYILAVDKRSGETVWKSDGLGVTSWASPRLIPVKDGEHLVLSGIGKLAGLDPQTGKRLWLFENIAGNSTPTPVPVTRGTFLVGATVGRGESSGPDAARSNGLITVSPGDSGNWNIDYAWRAKRATSSFGSPVPHEGSAWYVNRAGVLFGLDLTNGDEQISQRLAGSAWATPIGIGSQLFIASTDGTVNIVSLKGDSPEVSVWQGLPEEEPPAEAAPADAGGGSQQGPPDLGGSKLYSIVWTGNAMLLRRGDRLFSVPLVTQ